MTKKVQTETEGSITGKLDEAEEEYGDELLKWLLMANQFVQNWSTMKSFLMRWNSNSLMDASSSFVHYIPFQLNYETT